MSVTTFTIDKHSSGESVFEIDPNYNLDVRDELVLKAELENADLVSYGKEVDLTFRAVARIDITPFIEEIADDFGFSVDDIDVLSVNPYGYGEIEIEWSARGDTTELDITDLEFSSIRSVRGLIANQFDDPIDGITLGLTGASGRTLHKVLAPFVE